MRQLWDLPPGNLLRPRGGECTPIPRLARKAVLCLLPRSSRINPIGGLLRAYEVCVADSLGQLVRLSRERAFVLYVILAPLGWIGAAPACRRIRRFDPHTPIVCYAVQPDTAERREVLGAGAQAYVPRTEGSRVLSGTAAQLIMLTELRSDEALAAGRGAIREALAQRLAGLRRLRQPDPAALRPRTQSRLKAEARRLFAAAGGSRANFERLWPDLYRELLDDVAGGRSGTHK